MGVTMTKERNRATHGNSRPHPEKDKGWKTFHNRFGTMAGSDPSGTNAKVRSVPNGVDKLYLKWKKQPVELN